MSFPKILLSLFACIAIAYGKSAAQPAYDLFRQGNDAYRANDFDTAIGLYQQAGALDVQSAELEFNLANAYFRKGDLGRAVLHYERAKLLAPTDEDVAHNLAIALQKVEKRDELPSFFLKKIWENGRSALPEGTWAGLGLALWWTGFAGLGLWLMGKSRTNRKLGFIAGIACLLLSLLPFGLSASRLSFDKNSRSAIVLTTGAMLQSAPDAAGKKILNLFQGEKVALLDRLGGYWQVRLSNGEKGWVPEADVETI